MPSGGMYTCSASTIFPLQQLRAQGGPGHTSKQGVLQADRPTCIMVCLPTHKRALHCACSASESVHSGTVRTKTSQENLARCSPQVRAVGAVQPRSSAQVG